MTHPFQNSEGIGLHIKIFETCGYDPDSSGFLRPGNSLEGRIYITTKTRLRFTNLKVLFQGLPATSPILIHKTLKLCSGLESTCEFSSRLNSKNVCPHSAVYRDLFPVEARKLFLYVEYQAPLESIQEKDNQGALKLYSFPFFFIVPSATTRHDDGIQPLCQALPPSFEIISHLAPVISITYLVRAVLCFHTDGTQDELVATVTKNIKILPYTQIQPPLQTAWFPHEFTPSALIPLRRHIMGRSYGSLNFGAIEPFPLVYSSLSDSPSTNCELTITASITASAVNYLRSISLVINPAIYVRTFYSTRPIPCVSGRKSPTQDKQLRLEINMIQLESQRFVQMNWASKYPSATVHQPGIRAQQNENESGYLDSPYEPSTPTPGSSDILPENVLGVWETAIRVSVKPLKALLPTFCSALIARSYSLFLRVRVSGVYTRHVALEIPLQVVYSAPSQMVMALGPVSHGLNTGPTSVVMEGIDSPPHYG
ncbi:hypothetical protein BJX63DRAFT_437371 [Aspergillus granulosus]|uniref:Arrestin-like N-terminal domain-containing protein n=1 Tax=Aspergillus granulosus TaxID=176169 RepID=A0ABR4GVG0_9EURO